MDDELTTLNDGDIDTLTGEVSEWESGDTDADDTDESDGDSDESDADTDTTDAG